MISHLLPTGIDWNEENMKNWILEFHSSKNAVESSLHLESHDEISEGLLLQAKYKNINLAYKSLLTLLDQTGKELLL